MAAYRADADGLVAALPHAFGVDDVALSLADVERVVEQPRRTFVFSP
jgi:hypothetical protein